MRSEQHAPQGGVGEGLLESAGTVYHSLLREESANAVFTGREASDGVHSVAVGYGTMAADRMTWRDDQPRRNAADDETPTSPKGHQADENTKLIVEGNDTADEDRGRSQSDSKQRSQSVSTVASLRRSPSQSRSPPRKRHTARSGSISENIVEANGVKKIVLETTSSSDSEDKAILVQTDGAQDQNENANTDTEGTANDSHSASNSKKKRKK